MQDWDITSNEELKDAVRSLTQYDKERLDVTELDALVDDGKRTLALKADITQFFDDRGIAVALLGIVAARAKGAVENSPVEVKDISGQNVRFRSSTGDSLQLSQYESLTQLGLSESEKTDDTAEMITFTNDYLTDSHGT